MSDLTTLADQLSIQDFSSIPIMCATPLRRMLVKGLILQ